MRPGAGAIDANHMAGSTVSHNPYRHDSRKQEFADAPIREQPVRIQFQRKRLQFRRDSRSDAVRQTRYETWPGCGANESAGCVGNERHVLQVAPVQRVRYVSEVVCYGAYIPNLAKLADDGYFD
jgi:hypothetical protein